MWSRLANPHLFMGFSRHAIPLFYVVGVPVALWALYQGLWIVPKDEMQGGDIMRGMFIHVASAWLCLGLYTGLAVSSFVWFIWRHEVADVAARAIAPVGAVVTALCLLTGAIWGRPTWGEWWLWDDPRLMSTLALLFQYIGYMALRAALDTRQKAARAGAIMGMLGIILVFIVKYSVEFWSSIHQGASVTITEAPAMATVYLVPLLIGFLGQALIIGAIVMTVMRAEIYEQRSAAIMARKLGTM